MAPILLLLFVALPLIRLIIGLAWPGLLKWIEGRRAESALVSRFGDVHDDPVVSEIGQKLTVSVGVRARFGVLRSPERSAVALPNGRVVLWEGLLEETGDDQDMLAGALALQLGHLSHGHFFERIQWIALARFVLGLFGSGLRRRLNHITDNIVHHGFPRDLEQQADSAAVSMMEAAGYDPAGLARLLDRLARMRQSGTPNARAGQIRERLTREPRKDRPKNGEVIPFPTGPRS
ncbi:MAG: M48 family metallopeptidase [Myxococcota bacterium]